jgi:hypothetical protein
MSRADRCTWRYVSRRTGTAHAYELNQKRGRSLCRRFETEKYLVKTSPEDSPVPVCLVCENMLAEFRKYKQTRA